jgi:hypothetical protein
MTMRYGNAQRRGNRDAGGNAIDDFDVHARCTQCLEFFATPPEHEGISAFDARDTQTPAGKPHQLVLDE